MMSRTVRIHGAIAYIRNINASYHWTLLHVGPCGFVLESRKCEVLSFMTHLPSKCVGTLLGVFLTGRNTTGL